MELRTAIFGFILGHYVRYILDILTKQKWEEHIYLARTNFESVKICTYNEFIREFHAYTKWCTNGKRKDYIIAGHLNDQTITIEQHNDNSIQGQLITINGVHMIFEYSDYFKVRKFIRKYCKASNKMLKLQGKNIMR